MEIALAVSDQAPTPQGHERRMAGDIIAIRRPHHGIGKKETSEYLWLRIQGPDLSFLATLLQPMTDDVDALTGEVWEKRRYAIPLERLAQIVSRVDLDEVKNPSSFYQPFIGYDENNQLRVIPGTESPAIPVEGLIFDKLTGKYL